MTHTGDAMTREQVLEDIVAAFLERAADQDVLAGHHRTPDERPFCAVRATIWRAAARDLRSALASAQQEPAPSADAEEGLQSAWKDFWAGKNRALSYIDVQRGFKTGFEAALRRYAGDDGVTDEQVEAGAKALCRLRIERNAKYDGKSYPEEKMIASIEYAWRDYIEESRRALEAAARAADRSAT